MAKILCIETSTTVCSVALAEDEKLLGLEEISGVNSHSSHLAVCIDKLMKKTGTVFTELKAVAVSEGPGSYTGLRIGVSTAKGICFGMDIPLIAVGTLESLMQMYFVQNQTHSDTLYFPMIDAKRMEVYTQVFQSDGKKQSDTFPLVFEPHSFDDYLNKKRVVLFGEGSVKAKEIYSSAKIVVVDSVFVSAVGLIHPAYKKFTAGDFVDLAYFEPYYLKEFVAGLPKVKGLQ